VTGTRPVSEAPPAVAPNTLPGTAPPPDGSPGAGDGGRGQRTPKIILEWTLLIGGALLIAFLIKTFLFQAFYIPSESMTPTLQVGDRVLVNKLSYRLHDVNRGDVVVFEAPDDPNTDGVKDLVKRVIGLPGETVTLQGGHVFVDGRQLEESYLPEGTETVPICGQRTEFKVPKDHVLVFGDNRTNSTDGRCFGTIDEDTIVGRAFFRFWPLTELDWL
jgi:signal peptidase I